MQTTVQELKFELGGRLFHYYENWYKITSDKCVLKTIKYGVTLDFKKQVKQTKFPHQIKMSKKKEKFVEDKIDYLLKEKCIVELPSFDKSGFLNNVFLIEKHSGRDFRMILNCKDLNSFLKIPHFKTESIKDVMMKNSHFITADICDAYQHLRLRSTDFHWFQFHWKEHILTFTTLPQGMSQSPYEFCRVCRQISSYLRRNNTLLVWYFDDIIIIGNLTKIVNTVEILHSKLFRDVVF